MADDKQVDEGKELLPPLAPDWGPSVVPETEEDLAPAPAAPPSTGAFLSGVAALIAAVLFVKGGWKKLLLLLAVPALPGATLAYHFTSGGWTLVAAVAFFLCGLVVFVYAFVGRDKPRVGLAMLAALMAGMGVGAFCVWLFSHSIVWGVIAVGFALWLSIGEPFKKK